MTFDKSKVYTALNADEVKIGSKGYFGNSLSELFDYFINNRPYEILVKVLDDTFPGRFVNKEGAAKQLFYLVEESFKKEYRPYKDTEEMIKDFKKRFHVDNLNYTMPLIWVKEKAIDISMLITAFGAGNNRIYNHNHWINLKELLIYYTYLDGSPCGLLEK